MKRYKKKILSVMQLPPPVHGQSIMNQTIQQSKLLNDTFEMCTIPLHFSKLDNLGKADVKKILKMIYYAYLLINKITSFKPDLIYFTLSPVGFAFYRDCLYVMIIKFFRLPVVYHLHGKGIKKKSRNKCLKVIYSFVFKNSSVILLSKLLKSDIDDVISESTKLFYLPNGIREKSKLLPNEKCRKSIGEEPILLFLSNIKKSKGFFLLLEALSLLQKKKLPFKLKLVGGISASVPEKLLDRTIRNYNLERNVKYLGALYGEDKNRVLISSDIFVFPTYEDAFPLVILEAMQAGLPIVSTFEGAIPEMIANNENGFLVKQRDVAELACKLETLIKQKGMRLKFGERSLDRFNTFYTLQIFEENLKQILNQIVICQ